MMIKTARLRTVSALLLTPEGKLVAQLRDNKPGLPYPNCWSTLGGKIELGESPDDAMRRELIEEIEFCPPLTFWRAFDLHYVLRDQPTTSEVYAYVGTIDRDLAAVRLHEGQRLGTFGADDLTGAAFAFGLDQLFRDYFAEQARPAEAVQVRLAAIDESPIIHRLMQEAFAEYEGVLQPGSGANRETVADVQQAMAVGGAALAWRQGIPVGAARFRLEPDELYVGRVAVPPVYRQHGVGRAVMRFMEDVARLHRKDRIRVDVRKSLPQNVSFYQKLGYDIISINPHPRGPDQVVTLVKRILAEGEP
ncbi:MAG: GNAT family N-acetyltransferase [Anaerolineae bacterium]|nr:GNAT family N-acetyltransferase [Anaerolineae bacterium]